MCVCVCVCVCVCTHFVTFDDVWILRVQVLLHYIRETVLYELAQRRQLAILCHGLEELLKGGGGVRGGEMGVRGACGS